MIKFGTEEKDDNHGAKTDLVKNVTNELFI